MTPNRLKVLRQKLDPDTLLYLDAALDQFAQSFERKLRTLSARLSALAPNSPGPNSPNSPGSPASPSGPSTSALAAQLETLRAELDQLADQDRYQLTRAKVIRLLKREGIL